MNAQKLAQLKAGVRIGGRGSMRRKKKAKRSRNTSTDEKRLTSTLKRLGVQQIPGIEEINMFKEDGTVIHFTNPKFQASGAANTYVVTGRAENKSIQELLPGILDQLPNNSFPGGMNKLAEAFKSGLAGAGAGAGGDEIPDLVENFGSGDTSSGNTSAATEAAAPSAESAKPAESTTSSSTAPAVSDSAAKPAESSSTSTTSTSSTEAAAPAAEKPAESAPAATPVAEKPTESAPAATQAAAPAAIVDPTTGKDINMKAIPQGVSEDEVRDVITKFKALDRDSTGDLDKTELRNLLKNTIAGSMSDNLLDRFVSGQFENIDSDKNGKISFSEFLVVYANLKTQK